MRKIDAEGRADSARAPRRRGRWLLGLLAVSGLLLGLQAQRREQPADLISITGCDDLRREGGRYYCSVAQIAPPADSTAPAEPPVIRVHLRAPAGWLLPPVADRPVALRRDGDQFELTWTATAQPLRWHVSALDRHGWTRHGFELQRIEPGSEAAHVLAQRKMEGVESEGREAMLRQRLQVAGSDGERAILRNELGYQLYGQGRMPAAERELNLALSLAQASGWVSIAANSARILAGLRFREHGDVYAAEKLLHEHAPLIRLHAIENASMLFERAIHAAARGEIRLAQTYYREAFAEAQRVDYPDLRRYIEASHAALLWKSGEHRKAAEQAAELRAELGSLRTADFESLCTRALQLNRLASAELIAVESGQGHAEQTLTELSRALRYAESDGCQDTVLRASLYAHRARVALLLAEAAAAQPWRDAGAQPSPHAAASGTPHPWVSAAESDLAQARKEHPQQSSVRDLEYAELAGRLASLRDESERAIDLLQQAEQQAFALVDADARFRVLTALAVAHARKAAATQDTLQAEQHRQQARAKFDAAEAQLDERVLLVPLDVARRGFLPRYEPGIALHLRFLLDHGSAHDVLALMRRTQVRGLALAIHAARLTSGADGSSKDSSHDAQALVKLYLQRQRKLDADRPEDPQQQEDERQRIRELLARLQPSDRGRLPLRSLQAGEAMLICHALPAEQILCMTADAQARIAQVIFGRAELDAALTSIDAPRRVSRLLQPLLPIVQPARVLRVIPSALLRLIDVASLPHPTQPTRLFHSQRAVVYALDIDPSALVTHRPAAPSSGPDATLVVHGGIANSDSVPPLIQRMQALGWGVSPHAEGVMSTGAVPLRRLQCWLGLVDSCRHPLLPADMPSSALRPGDAKTVLASLDGSRLAHFFTHAAYDSTDGGWQSAIVMPDHSTLQASALMGMSQAPRFAVLITCEGGQSGVGTEPEDISLAQVFLLRGGQAVAASRHTLDAGIGAAWARALYEAEPVAPWAPGALMSAQSPDLGAAFHAAQLRLLSQEPATVSWQALRLYVL